MKLRVYKFGNKVEFEDVGSPDTGKIVQLGEVDLPIVAPKKTVERRARQHQRKECCRVHDYVEFEIPVEAKNIKCTYEVEE